MRFFTNFATVLVLCSLVTYFPTNAQSFEQSTNNRDVVRRPARPLTEGSIAPSDSSAPRTTVPRRVGSVTRKPPAPKQVEGDEEEGEGEELENARKGTAKKSTRKSTGKAELGAKKVTPPKTGISSKKEGTTRGTGSTGTGNSKTQLPKKSTQLPKEKNGEENDKPTNSPATRKVAPKKAPSNPPTTKEGGGRLVNPPATKKPAPKKAPSNPPTAKKGEKSQPPTEKPKSKEPLAPSGPLEVSKCVSSSNEGLDLRWVKASPFPLSANFPLRLSLHGNFPKGLKRGSKLDILASFLFFTKTVTLDICDELENGEVKVKCPLAPGIHTLTLTVPKSELVALKVSVQARGKDENKKDMFCFNTIMDIRP